MEKNFHALPEISTLCSENLRVEISKDALFGPDEALKFFATLQNFDPTLRLKKLRVGKNFRACFFLTHASKTRATLRQAKASVNFPDNAFPARLTQFFGGWTVGRAGPVRFGSAAPQRRNQPAGLAELRNGTCTTEFGLGQCGAACSALVGGRERGLVNSPSPRSSSARVERLSPPTLSRIEWQKVNYFGSPAANASMLSMKYLTLPTLSGLPRSN